MSLTSNQITAKNFKKFYESLLPYLNSSPGCTPIGTVIAVMGKSAPANYLVCDGTIYNISDYQDLANYFETQFEEKNFFGGDGETTFAVPDLRGEFLRGAGTNSHENGGVAESVGVHQTPTLNDVILANTSSKILQARGIPDGANNVAPLDMDSIVKASELTGVKYIQSPAGTVGTPATTVNAYYTVRPTNTSVLYCIAYKDIYLEEGGGGSAYTAGDGIDITNDIISVDEMAPEDMSEIISPSPSIMCRRMIYTESDQIVGTWIDGSTVYQKTFTGKTSTTSGKSVKLGELPNMAQVISKNGFYHHLGGYWVGLDEYQSSTAIVALFIYDNGEVYVFAQGDNNRLNRDVVVTIQYTKTV